MTWVYRNTAGEEVDLPLSLIPGDKSGTSYINNAKHTVALADPRAVDGTLECTATNSAGSESHEIPIKIQCRCQKEAIKLSIYISNIPKIKGCVICKLVFTVMIDQYTLMLVSAIYLFVVPYRRIFCCSPLFNCSQANQEYNII